MKANIGDRVGAVQSLEDDELSDNDVAKFFGYGVYIGEKPLPERFLGYEGTYNACILLDSGAEVFGVECWWGSEEYIRRVLKRCKVIMVLPPGAARNGRQQRME